MIHLGNSAGRLHNFLTNAKEKNKNTNTRIVLADLLKTEKSLPLLYKRMGILVNLPKQVKEVINTVENINFDLYLKWYNHIQAVFNNLNLNSNFVDFIGQIREQDLYGIEVCSDFLSRTIHPEDIDENQLNTIRQEAVDLLDSIAESGLNESLKSYVIEKLNQVIESIDEYPISGKIILEDIVKSTISDVALNPAIFDEIKKSERGKKFWTILTRIALIVAITAGSIQIGKDVIKFLPDASKTDNNIELKIEQKDNKEDLV
jgi:hypothetical protein